MPTLYEQLQAKLAALGQQPQVEGSEQSAITAAIKAKTGKAPTTGAVAQSTLGEQAAQGMAKANLAQQTQTGTLAAQQLGEQATAGAEKVALGNEALAANQRTAASGLGTQARVQRGAMTTAEQLAEDQRTATSFMKMASMNQKAEQGLQTLATQYQTDTDKLFGAFGRENAKLNLDKYNSDLNQALFNATMANKKYIQEIENTGKIRRLDNDANFKRELTETMLSKDLANYMDGINAQKIFDQDHRGFVDTLNRLDMNSKIEIAKLAAKNARDRFWKAGIFSTSAPLIQAGSESYKSYSTPSSKPTSYTETNAGDFENNSNTERTA